VETALFVDLGSCVVRDWRPSDAEALARHANSRAVWRNLRDAFPHPYSLADAELFLGVVGGLDPCTFFAVEVDGEAAGGIGYTLQSDVERLSAEIGYWLGERVRGRGIATAAVRAVTGHAFREHGLRRVFALPFAWNAASARVLEKAGYTLEGRMRQSAVKDGQVVDQLLYAVVRDDWAASGPEG
jgi:RimJ/RimL family protein N-acetyltransferase